MSTRVCRLSSGRYDGVPAMKELPLSVRVFQSLVPKAIRPRSFAERKLRRLSNGRVLGGPFKGMRYFPPYQGVGWRHRVLGTYEAEIHGAIERVVEQGFTRVINVGAAEGYYTVGFALRMPSVQVSSFELDPSKRDLATKLASMNGVSDRI